MCECSFLSCVCVQAYKRQTEICACYICSLPRREKKGEDDNDDGKEEKKGTLFSDMQQENYLL